MLYFIIGVVATLGTIVMGNMGYHLIKAWREVLNEIDELDD